MRKINLLALVLLMVLAASLAGPSHAQDPDEPNGVKALLLLPHQFGANTFLAMDDFAQFGWEMTLVGEKEEVIPCRGFSAFSEVVPETVDLLYDEVGDVGPYDVVVLMPGSQAAYPPYGDVLESEAALGLIAQAAKGGKIVYSACLGANVLAAAGILDDVTITGPRNCEEPVEEAGGSYAGNRIPPIIDGNIVTSTRALYYHENNTSAIAIALENTAPDGVALAADVADIESVPVALEDVTWASAVGGTGADGARAVAATMDGGLVAVGYTFSYGEGHSDMIAVKFDAGGVIDWARTFGGSGWEYADAVVGTQDGGAVVAGYTTSEGEGSRDVYVVKLDATGEAAWTQTIGGPGVDVARGVCEAGNGDLIVVGDTQSFGAGEDDLYVIRLDEKGDEIWSNTYGGDGPETAASGCVATDDGIFVVGSTGSFHAMDRDIYLVKLDGDGDEVWTQMYNTLGYDFDWANNVIATDDGGYLIVGASNTQGRPMRAYLMKVAADGTRQWEGLYGEGLYNYGHAVIPTADGYLLVGTSKWQDSPAQNDVLLVAVDAAGAVVWQRTLGVDGDDWASAMAVTVDGDPIVVGHTTAPDGTLDMLLTVVSAEK
jgi:hypothetical protein